jgi:hypothetical protein
MDIGALGGQYIDQSRYGVESLNLRFAGIARRGAAEKPAAGQTGENSFERYLEAARQKNTDTVPASSKKPRSKPTKIGDSQVPPQ